MLAASPPLSLGAIGTHSLRLAYLYRRRDSPWWDTEAQSGRLMARATCGRL
jgi:hypothetical protein